MEVFSFNYSQNLLKINMYSHSFLNVSLCIINFKWQKQHSESWDSQCSFRKWELQNADDISSDVVFRSQGDYSNFTRRERNQPLLIKILHKYWWRHILVGIRIKLSKTPLIHSLVKDSNGCCRIHIKEERSETQKIWIKQEQCPNPEGRRPTQKLSQAAYISVMLKPKCTATKFLKIKHRVLSNLKF